MLYLKVLLTSFLAIISLFLLAKCMGNRQVSQLSMFDYINGISIGSIAAEMAIATNYKRFFTTFLAMVIFAVCTILVSFICEKSLKFRRFANGTAVIVYDNGKIFKQNLKKGKLDINEFLMQCRISGYFNLSQLQTVILEPNGKLSFLPKSIDRPVTPTDLNIAVKSDKIKPCVIIDGKVLSRNLKSCGVNEQFLKNRLKEIGINSIEDVFLATIDENKKLYAYSKYEEITEKDFFV